MRQVTLIIADDLAGRRVDLIPSTDLGNLSRARIQHLIRTGAIRVNGRNVKPSCILRAGDQIVCEIPEPVPLKLVPQPLPIQVLYQDSDIIVVDKPRGMVVHPGAGVSEGTLVHALLYLCYDLSGIGGVLRPGIVHRLDKGTSGVIIAAKNDHAHASLANQFSSRTMEKEYWVLVAGIPEWKETVLEAPIGRHPHHRVKMAVVANGKKARTSFNVVAYGDSGALIFAKPSSGRTHQIRVHLEALKHPVLGDPIYGTGILKKTSGPVREALKAMRGFCLHARTLRFNHPSDGRRIEMNAPLPDDFRRVLEALNIPAEKGG